MNQLDILVSIALDLTSVIHAEERYRRLLEALHRVIPYDASALLRLQGDELVPIVSRGLSPDAMGRRFALREHPRLAIICKSAEPVHFPADSNLPDPFDGLLADDAGEFKRIHACFGCPLRIRDELVGVLTADAARPNAFDGTDRQFLSAVGALAAAEMQTTRLIEALEQSAERQGLIARDLMRDVQIRQGTDLIGTSPAIERLRQDMDLVARSDFTVLIMGETGVGKELVARAVHAGSDRHDEPMLYVNCAALPESLADSELFGHVRGAFTGATADRPGKFEVASGGTLFLDEIGELPFSVQPKLLRALQQGEIQRVGSDKMTKADVRVIAATNRNLEEEVKAGKFRADLFHRLCVYPLTVPPLRERVDDIPILAGYFCDITRQQLGLGPVRLAPQAIDVLKAYRWPGNVRELGNVLSRAVLKAAAGIPRGDTVILQSAHLGSDFADQATSVEFENGPGTEARIFRGLGMQEATKKFQKSLIQQSLTEHAGNWSAAARSLEMHRSNLHHLAVRLGLK
ncbi:MAG: nitric oxide reductase transcriptional regulator NorR [Pirellulales bacterium]|nr:nitric oxide reductase transcriptional regulator NorR [Pirellulales bacterium]